ncbi:hypothetical protein [Streptomyces sp. NPDC088762]|uniref:hypothetical protein n=1 Tax=Streptomyces sp. NPDC088762 TaxID=3365891 RepID=UPI00382A58DB
MPAAVTPGSHSASGVQDAFGPAPEGLAPARPRFVGHFAGIMLDGEQVDLASLPLRLPGPAPEVMATDLDAVDTVLSERASQLGVDFRRGVAVLTV